MADCQSGCNTRALTRPGEWADTMAMALFDMVTADDRHEKALRTQQSGWEKLLFLRIVTIVIGQHY